MKPKVNKLYVIAITDPHYPQRYVSKEVSTRYGKKHINMTSDISKSMLFDTYENAFFYITQIPNCSRGTDILPLCRIIELAYAPIKDSSIMDCIKDTTENNTIKTYKLYLWEYFKTMTIDPDPLKRPYWITPEFVSLIEELKKQHT